MVGDVILFKGTSFIGKLICWITASPYCHCVLDIGGGLIAEYDGFYGKGKIKREEESVDGYETDRYRLKSEYVHFITDGGSKMRASAAHICRTREYNVVLSMVAGLYHWCRCLVRLPEIEYGTHCSGMVAEVYRKTAVDLVPGVPDALTTPALLSQSPLLENVNYVGREQC